MIDLKRLKTVLLTSGLQLRDPPLYQLINQLLDDLQSFIGATNIAISGGGGGSGSTINNITNQILQLINTQSNLIQDRKSDTFYMMGSSGPVVVDTYAVPLTNGDPEAPEIIFDSFGDVVMVTGIPF